LLGDDAVAKHPQLSGAGEAVAGDPACGEAHHPFDEGGVEASVRGGVWCWSAEGVFPSGDGGGVGTPGNARTSPPRYRACPLPVFGSVVGVGSSIFTCSRRPPDPPFPSPLGGGFARPPAVGRLLPEGWRVERTYGYDGGTIIRAASGGIQWKRVPHGETVDCIIEREWYCEGDAIGYPYAGVCSPVAPIHNEPCGWLRALPADVDAATRQAVQ